MNNYESNFFHINIDGDVKFPIPEMNNHEYGVFLHEYIHYIQHLTTIFGIKRTSVFNQLYGNILGILLKQEEIHIPINIINLFKGNKFVEHLFTTTSDGYFVKVQGSRYWNQGNIEKIVISKEAIAYADLNQCAVALDVYVEEKQQPILGKLKFGYWCIIESMAHLIQKEVESEVYHNIVPYCVVDYICESYCPDFVRDKKMLISFCICSLLYANPGVAFFQIIDEARARRLDNGYTLYKILLRDKKINYNKNQYTIPEFVCETLDDMLYNVKAAVHSDLVEFSRIIKNCKLEINNKENAILDTLYNFDIQTQEGFNRLFKVYGIPFILAKNTIYPQDESILEEMSLIIGLELLYKRLVIKQEENMDKDSLCPMYQICMLGYHTENCKISLECQVNQWDKKEDCFFIEILKYYGLRDKKFMQDI